MSDFFNMGGYASYIWPAYGLTALVLTGLIVQSQRAFRRASRAVERLESGAPVYGSPKNAEPVPQAQAEEATR